MSRQEINLRIVVTRAPSVNHSHFAVNPVEIKTNGTTQHCFEIIPAEQGPIGHQSTYGKNHAKEQRRKEAKKNNALKHHNGHHR